MVDPAWGGAASVESLGDILQGRFFRFRRLVLVGLPVELEDMAVGAVEAVGGPRGPYRRRSSRCPSPISSITLTRRVERGLRGGYGSRNAPCRWCSRPSA